MQVSVGGPQSQLEAEAKKKLITEREIKAVLENDSTSKELRPYFIIKHLFKNVGKLMLS